jgi:hypothetical protein
VRIFSSDAVLHRFPEPRAMSTLASATRSKIALRTAAFGPVVAEDLLAALGLDHSTFEVMAA